MKSYSFPLSMAGLAVALLLGGCAADRIYREGMDLIETGHPQAGVAKLNEAQQADPGNAQYRKDWLLQRDRLILRNLAAANHERSAGNWDAAAKLYGDVQQLDPNNSQARTALSVIPQERRQAQRIEDAQALVERGDLNAATELVTKVLVENPNHVAALALKRRIQDMAPPESTDGAKLNIKNGKPVSLQFRDASLRQVMEAIARTTGLNVMFDKDVKSDVKVSIFVHDAPVDEAVDLILMQTQNRRRVLSENSILIYPDTDSKAKDYADLKIRRFALTNADPKQVQSMIKTLLKTKDMYVDEKTNALVIRDTPQVIRMAEKLITSADQPEPEVMLDVDVMEVSRARMLALGIDLPTTFGASTSGMTLQQFRNLTDADVNVTGLNFGVKAQKIDGDINDLATPRIRVRNHEKAKFLVGDRLPVVSTAAVPTTTATSPVYNTSVQYVDVGIKIEVEPTIYDDGEVAIRMQLEVSSNSGQNADAAKTGTIAYTISTRSVNTVLRLKDGQTEIIGGLIQHQDESNATKIPGLGDIPAVGRLFGSQTDKRNKSEIIMSITPHVVRTIRQPDYGVLEMWAGTESNFRFGARNLVAANVANGAASAPINAAAPNGAVGGVARTAAAPAPVAAMPPAPVPGVRVPPPAAAVPVAAAAPAPASQAGAAQAAAKAVAPKAPPAPAQLTPFVLNGPATAKPGARIDVSLVQPIYHGSESAELSVNFDPDHLRLVSATEGDPARNQASGTKFSSDVDASGSVHFSLTAASGQVLPEAGGALALMQFEVLGDPGSVPLGISDIAVKSADGSAQAIAPSAPYVLEVQGEQ